MDTSKGVYLSNPHGRMIYEGDKTMIAVAKRLPIEGERVICSKENGRGLAYGVAIIGDPSVVDIETFDARFKDHRVPRASRSKWWPDTEHLYLYPIRYFAPFSTPKPIDVPPGTTMDMSTEVKFLEEQEDSTEQLPFDEDPNLVIMSSSDTIEEEKTMPVDVKIWKPSDALRHTKKADTPKKQAQWVATANSRLAACKKEGGDPKECEASAIRVANAAVAKSGKKQQDELTDLSVLRKVLTGILSTEDDDKMLTAITSLYDLAVATSNKAGDDGDGELAVCTCPSCKEEADGEPDVPCKEMECPGCGAKMRGGAEEDEEEKATAEQITEQKEEKAVVQEEEENAGDDSDEEEPKHEEETKAGRRFSTSILAKLRKLGESITELIQHGEYADKQPEPDPITQITTQLSKGFKSLGTDPQGRTWFMICPTNSYYDREGEAFATKAIHDYVDRHADDEIKGETWFLHTKGSKFGTIREQAVVGEHFVCQLGTYDDTPIGNAFKSFFIKHPDSHPTIAPNGWGASHKYDYILEDRKDNVYEFFDIQESTVLPLDIAANVYNLQPVLGGFKMNEQQKAAFEEIGMATGVPDLVEQITTQADAAKNELDGKGVERKEVGEEHESASSDESTAIPDTVKAIADALQLDSLSKVIGELAESVKTQNERLTALETTVTRTEEETKASLIDNLPRYSWYPASQADETVTKDKDIKTINTNNVAGNPVVQGLVGMMEGQI